MSGNRTLISLATMSAMAAIYEQHRDVLAEKMEPIRRSEPPLKRDVRKLRTLKSGKARI